MKRLLSMIICVSVCIFLLTGCNYMLGETDTLLRAPEPQGNLREISEALESTVGKKFTLKSPKSGDWRTAFIVKDTDGDGGEEALAFYSLTTENGSELHMSVIDSESKEWRVLSDFSLGGTDIERVELADLNGDQSEEVLVAWSIYGAPETRLTVFALKSGSLLPMYESGYTDFCVYDVAEGEGNELLILTTDPDTKTTRCSMLYGEENKLYEWGNTLLSGSISAVKKFHKTKIDGSPALYIDATTADGGYFTEIVTINNGKLSIPLSSGGGKANVITGRYQALNCGDVDGDGDLDIPCMTVLPSGGNSDSALYLTEWKEYRDRKLHTVEKSVISKLMQYKIKVQSDWQGKFSCVYSGENDGIDLYSYNAKKGLGEKVLSLIAVNRDGFDKNDYRDMFIIDKNDKSVYLCKIHEKDNKLNITEDKVKSVFSQNITEGNGE